MKIEIKILDDENEVTATKRYNLPKKLTFGWWKNIFLKDIRELVLWEKYKERGYRHE